MRILLIEDDEHQAELMKHRLHKRHELHFADKLETGVEQCNLLKPDVVMVDLGLPDALDYKDTMSKIARVRLQAAVIIITGMDATLQFIDECRQHRTDAFIVKGRGDRSPEILDAVLAEAVAHRKRFLSKG